MQELTSEQKASILLLEIEQKLRQVIANQIESHFHDTHHDQSHEIAEFVRFG
jgi:hypothetical protein